MDKVIRVLLVEDDPIDQIQVQRALDKKGLLYKMTCTANGEEAIEYLKGASEGKDNGLPHIILLDLNMPKMGGIEFLREFRNREEWSPVKVFLLTNSDQGGATDTFGVSGHITKPLRFNSPSLDTITLMIDMMNLSA